MKSNIALTAALCLFATGCVSYDPDFNSHFADFSYLLNRPPAYRGNVPRTFDRSYSPLPRAVSPIVSGENAAPVQPEFKNIEPAGANPTPQINSNVPTNENAAQPNVNSLNSLRFPLNDGAGANLGGANSVAPGSNQNAVTPPPSSFVNPLQNPTVPDANRATNLVNQGRSSGGSFNSSSGGPAPSKSSSGGAFPK